MMADGMTVGEIIAEYPDLTLEDVGDNRVLISADTDLGTPLAGKGPIVDPGRVVAGGARPVRVHPRGGRAQWHPGRKRAIRP
jgi:hypothetical protein